MIGSKFFQRDATIVAKELVGNYFVSNLEEGRVVGKIVEAEAYSGQDDLACHARFGITPRTKTLFEQPGRLYVYLNYGIFWLTNIVSHSTGSAGGVLIRSAEIVEGSDIARKRVDKHRFVKKNEFLASGPGKFSVAFGIDGSLNNRDITSSDQIFIKPCPVEEKNFDIIETTRIGVDYAGHCKDYPWRFYIKDNKFVSKE